MITFRYFYKITNGPPPGYHHIAQDLEVFLCGKVPDSDSYQIELQALPGLGLCEICKQERDRIKKHRPTQANLANWWAGGREAHLREMGKNQ
jgi:hypothetical protein